MVAIPPKQVPDKIKKYFSTAKKYVNFQNIVGALDDINLKLILENLDELEKSIIVTEDNMENLPVHTIRDKFTTVISNTHNAFIKEGYWIVDNEIYPNIGAFHLSMQKSSYNRTPEYKRTLKRALLAWKAKFHPKNYVTNVREASFEKYLNEVKK